MCRLLQCCIGTPEWPVDVITLTEVLKTSGAGGSLSQSTGIRVPTRILASKRNLSARKVFHIALTHSQVCLFCFIMATFTGDHVAALEICWSAYRCERYEFPSFPLVTDASCPLPPFFLFLKLKLGSVPWRQTWGTLGPLPVPLLTEPLWLNLMVHPFAIACLSERCVGEGGWA